MKTIKMVLSILVPLNPNLKVGVNEKLSFHTASVAVGSVITYRVVDVRAVTRRYNTILWGNAIVGEVVL
jgi:hypothetical protein